MQANQCLQPELSVEARDATPGPSLRFTTFELFLSFTLFTLTIPWPLQIGPASVTSFDVITPLFLLLIGGTLLVRQRFRAARSFLLFLSLFLFWQLWMSVALIISNPDGKQGVQLGWHLFKNVWLTLAFPIVGFMLARTPAKTRALFISGLLFWTAVSAGIGIVQTASGGKLLSGIVTNQRFLGFLTPLPQDRFAYFDFELARQQGRDATFIGSIFRAHGPFEEANPFTMLLAPVAGFAIGLLPNTPSLRQRRWYLLALAVILLGLLVSFGIAGYFALFAGAMWAVVLYRSVLLKYLRKPYVLALAGCLLVSLLMLILATFVLPDPLLDPASPISQRLGRLASPLESNGLKLRQMIWEITVTRVQKSPWFGTGTFLRQYDVWVTGPTKDQGLGVMNSFLALALFTGIPSQLLLILFILMFLRASWRVYRFGHDEQTRALGFGCHLFFLLLAIVGLVYDWVPTSNMLCLFLLCGGLCVTLAARNPDPLAGVE